MVLRLPSVSSPRSLTKSASSQPVVRASRARSSSKKLRQVVLCRNNSSELRTRCGESA
jgi:hypothetical protein